jgi:2-haloacid dehalogenase
MALTCRPNGEDVKIDRRKFLAAGGLTATGLVLSTESDALASLAAEHRPIRAIVFDGFVIFDSRAVAKRVEEVVAAKATDFANLWRTRQFEYTWLRTLGGQYQDFWRVTQDALTYTAASLKISLSPEQRDRLMSIYLELPAWPDVPDALAAFRRHGIKLAFLSNLTKAMLDANVARNKLQEFFAPHLTTDRVRAYKPSPKAYQMAVDAFRMQREEIAFAAFGGWDAAGAKWFGYPTAWVNRAGAAVEGLGVQPDEISNDMSGLEKLVATKK